MSDLITFLNARLDEDEAAAYPKKCGCLDANHVPSCVPTPWLDRPRREVAAKRAMLAQASETWHWYQGELSEDGGDKYGDGTLNDVRERWDTWEIALRCLAAVYSDHPDYRPDWKP